MEKINVVLVLMNRDLLDGAIKNLNFDNVNLSAIIMDNDYEENFQLGETPMTILVGEEQIPVDSFALMQKVIRAMLKNAKDYLWLIRGCVKDLGDLLKAKRFLMTNGVPERNIVNFEVASQISATWLANLNHVENFGADYFATGDEYTRGGLNMNLIPSDARGVNLADVNQDLRQSWLTAKYVFEHVKPGTIKFVLIGLAPHSFYYDNAKDFLHAPKNLQYACAFDKLNVRDEMLMNLISDDAKKFFATATEADVNFDGIRQTLNGSVSAKAIAAWGSDTKFLAADSFDDNVQILQNYIELCLEHGAQPIGVIFPFAPATRKNYNADLLKVFRATIRELEENYDFPCVDMFEMKIGNDCFFDMTHVNSKGQIFTSALLSLKLFNKGLLPAENFLDTTYEYLKRLALIAPKDDYNALTERVFDASAKKIAGKSKIKIGFAMLEAAHWCGKDLYNFFAGDERFDTTVFLSMDFHKDINDVVKKDFLEGVEQLRSHGLNVVAVDDFDANIPAQDVMIYLTPYMQYFAKPFQIQSLTPKTLIAYIPYAYDSSFHIKSFYSQMIILIAWKIFFSSTVTFDLYKEKAVIGAPRGIYSGYPKMDIFFKADAEFNFDWKTTRPDAKKIIWAPHHSIASTTSIVYATFQWNYEFMYEFAKAHPETSWIVKPHPWLFFTAVTEKIFPSAEALDEYWRKWNELPNAQVYIGAYYQHVFATSDAMIHDCGSFIAEYQYVDKPMIYLTRDTQKFNDLGDEILKVSYCVDGQDSDAIAATIQRVIIEGDDYQSAARREIFDKYLNYPQANGMLASEFIYRSIDDEFKLSSE